VEQPREEMIMSSISISSVDKALNFRREPKLGPGLAGVLAAVRTYWSAMLDGLAAARTYHELTTRGVPHEVAVEKTFDRHLSKR
jgi:hypothetical protein